MKSEINYKHYQSKKEYLMILENNDLNKIKEKYQIFGEEFIAYLAELLIKNKDIERINFLFDNFNFSLDENSFLNCTCSKVFKTLIKRDNKSKHINDDLLLNIIKRGRSYFFLLILLDTKLITNDTLEKLFIEFCKNGNIKYLETLIEHEKFKEINVDINKGFLLQRNKQISLYFLRFKEINKDVCSIIKIIDKFKKRDNELSIFMCNFINEFDKKTPYKGYLNKLKLNKNIDIIKKDIEKINNMIKIKEF